MKKSSIFLKKPIDKGERPCYNEYKFKGIEQNRCNGRKDEVIMNVTMKAMLEKLVKDFNDYFELHRKSFPKIPGAAKTKQSTRKYVCPMCGTIIRATKEVHVVCGDCEVEFEEEA